MEALRTITRVDIHRIDESDTFYRISTDENLESLCRSISEIGLLCPPLLIEKGARSFTIVSGFRRIAACKSLNLSQIEAYRIREDLSASRLALMAVSENSLCRPLNPIETARGLRLLSRTTDSEPDFRDAARKASLPYHPGLNRKLMSLLDLPLEVRNAVITGDLPVAIATELFRLGVAEAARFSEIFSSLKLSLNKQREVMTLCEEISLREDLPVLRVLHEPGFLKILDNPDLDRNQKSRALRLYLRQRRFPSLSRAEAAFAGIVKRLDLGAGVQLQPPKDFEGTAFSLCLKFETAEQLAAAAAEIDRIQGDPALGDMLSVTSL